MGPQQHGVWGQTPQELGPFGVWLLGGQAPGTLVCPSLVGVAILISALLVSQCSGLPLDIWGSRGFFIDPGPYRAGLSSPTPAIEHIFHLFNHIFFLNEHAHTFNPQKFVSRH